MIEHNIEANEVSTVAIECCSETPPTVISSCSCPRSEFVWLPVEKPGYFRNNAWLCFVIKVHHLASTRLHDARLDRSHLQNFIHLQCLPFLNNNSQADGETRALSAMTALIHSKPRFNTWIVSSPWLRLSTGLERNFESGFVPNKQHDVVLACVALVRQWGENG